MIEVNNLTAAFIDEEFLKEVTRKILKGEKQKNKDLSIALVDKATIKKLNKKYRKKDKPTDVLSFSYDGLGEIVISPEIVKKNAKKFKSAFRKELARVLIHGVLHLLGEDHEGEKPAQSKALRRARQNTKFLAGKMEEKENYYFKPWQKIV